jgi:colanic acid/amylovoran biosynthesis glycosyltransferase
MSSTDPGQPVRGQPRVAYVLKQFPKFRETFVLNEILELERQGVYVEIFSLQRPWYEPRHALLSKLKAPIAYLPSSSRLDHLTVRVAKGGMEPETRRVEALIAAGTLPMSELMEGMAPTEALVLALIAWTLAMVAAAREIRHLHAHFCPKASTAALLASRISKIPYSCTAHAQEISHTFVAADVAARIRRVQLFEAEFVVAVSEYERRHLVELAGADAMEKIHCLYNGVDLSRFRQPDSAERDPRLILSIARLVENNGLDDLVEACGLLETACRPFRCLIVGEGPLRESLERQIAELGLARHVELVGNLPYEQILELMRQASVFALPCIASQSDDRARMPTVLLEALASGLPVITTTVAAISEIVDHGQCGLLVPPGAPRKLADAIGSLMADPALWVRFAQLGRAKAERDFDLAANVGKLRRLFLGGGGPAVRGPTRSHDADRVPRW